MQYEMMESLFEFGITIQTLVKQGWEFKLEYGEKRLGVDNRLIARKDDKEFVCYTVDDLEQLKWINYDKA